MSSSAQGPIAIALPVSRRYHRPLNQKELRVVEARLADVDALFISTYVYGAQTLAIRDELRSLLGKVVAERIRAEARERNQQRPPQVH